jgi:hypothetical protein
MAKNSGLFKLARSLQRCEHLVITTGRITKRRLIMTKFDIQSATTYAVAAAISLVSTAMLFAATAVPQMAHVATQVA